MYSERFLNCYWTNRKFRPCSMASHKWDSLICCCVTNILYRLSIFTSTKYSIQIYPIFYPNLSKYSIQILYPICEIVSISLYPKSNFIQIFYPNTLSNLRNSIHLSLSNSIHFLFILHSIQIFYPKVYPFWAFYPKSVYPKFRRELQYRRRRPDFFLAS